MRSLYDKTDVEFSSCCCGIFSLRQGCFIFALFILLNGIGEIIGYNYTGLIELVIGALGIYGSVHKREKFIEYYIYALCACFIIRISLLIVLGAQSHLLIDEHLKQICELNPAAKECDEYRIFQEFSGAVRIDYFYMAFMNVVRIFMDQ